MTASQENCIDRADTAGCNGKGWKAEQSYTLNTVDRPAVVYDARGNGKGEIAPTQTGDHQSRVTDYTALVVRRCRGGLPQRHGKHRCQWNTASQSNGRQSLNLNNTRGAVTVMRRMTPLECERLQGFLMAGQTSVSGWTAKESVTKRARTANAIRHSATALPSAVAICIRDA